MMSPEEQQIEICLLKSNLEEIGNNLAEQRSALPQLDAEYERKYQEAMTSLHALRSLNSEIERLDQEDVRLSAKITQIKRQCEESIKGIEHLQEIRKELEISMKQVEQNVIQQICKYEDSLREKADRYRGTSHYYNEEEINAKTEADNQMIIKAEVEEERLRNTYQKLREELMSLKGDVPQEILAIFGKNEIDDELNTLTDNCKDKREQLDNKLKCFKK